MRQQRASFVNSSTEGRDEARGGTAWQLLAVWLTGLLLSVPLCSNFPSG
jgi:hypothetical protein